jgi:hypothetical protein
MMNIVKRYLYAIMVITNNRRNYMILDLGIRDTSFSKILVLIQEAEALTGNSTDEDKTLEQHRISYDLYKLIKDNDKERFHRMIVGYLSELNSLALGKPYNNQNILLLVKALNAIAFDHYYYDDLQDLYSDIQFHYIHEFNWDRYREQPAELDDEPPHEEAGNLNANDFDFEYEMKPASESVIRKQNTINEKNVIRLALADSEKAKTNIITEQDRVELHVEEFDFGSSPEATDERKSVNPNEKRAFKPWVKPFFTLSGVTLFGLLIYGYFV